jgi:uncharacterized membrane protein YqjE
MSGLNEPPRPDVQPLNFILKVVTVLLLLAAAVMLSLVLLVVVMGWRNGQITAGTIYLSILLVAAFVCEWSRRKFVLYRAPHEETCEAIKSRS